MMRSRYLVILGTAVTALGFFTSPVLAVNNFTAESKTFIAGSQACTVGVYLTHDFPIVAAVLAVELRSLTGGAYIGGTINSSTFSFGTVPGGRIDNSPLGPAGANWPDAIMVTNYYANAGGTCQDPAGATTTTYSTTTALPNAISPDGFLHAAVSTGDPNIGEEYELMPGTDPPGEPSFRFIFPLNANPGTFVIDSCCTALANLCAVLDRDANLTYATFTAGVITVVACGCDCLGDPACDGIRSDIRDVVTTIDIALRGEASVPDPSQGCVTEPTDVDCSGATDIVDVVHVIEVAFRSADPSTEYCDPCE